MYSEKLTTRGLGGALWSFFFFQAEDGIRDLTVTGVQTCALPIFFVDAIQSLGVFPLDVRRTPIDALAADGHKWLLGPEGAGIGYVRREWVERLHPFGVDRKSVV